MIKLENHLGTIEISQDYFAKLVGHAVSRRDLADKGVRVRGGGKALYIDLHIAVTYGVNIAAIVKSIVNKVRYTVEEATGFEVNRVNVYVDDMKAQ